jgi:hypothetical protein
MKGSVEVVEVFSKLLHAARCERVFRLVLGHSVFVVDLLGQSIFIYSNLVGFTVCIDQLLKQGLLESHGVEELLTSGANGWLETNHVKVQLLASDDALDEVGKLVLRPAGQKHRDGVLLLHGESNQFDLLFPFGVRGPDTNSAGKLFAGYTDNQLIPPALPGPRLLLLDALSSGSQDGGIMPPASIDKDIGSGKLPRRRAGPEGLVGEGTRKY